MQLYYTQSWGDPMTHLLSWVVSVNTARQHYPDTMLVTDTPGKRLLVDRLGLEFGAVSTELDRLETHDAGWWALGKLVAYSLQTRPFVHIDSDVYLWKRLPHAMEQAPVLAQHPEYHVEGRSDYRPSMIGAAMVRAGGILPDEWLWGCERGPELKAENCGIVGGQDTAFLRHYATSAITLAERPENAEAWHQVGAKQPHNIVLEQYFLSSCLGYHHYGVDSQFAGTRVEYLFRSWDEAMDDNMAARAGYTHLMGPSKGSRAARRRLEARVLRDYPHYFRRCEKTAAELIRT